MSMERVVDLLSKLETLLTMQVFQLIELNGLIKKLNQISGTSASISEDEILREMQFLRDWAECITTKGTICPIKGLARKLGKGLVRTLAGEGEEGEQKDGQKTS